MGRLHRYTAKEDCPWSIFGFLGSIQNYDVNVSVLKNGMGGQISLCFSVGDDPNDITSYSIFLTKKEAQKLAEDIDAILKGYKENEQDF